MLKWLAVVAVGATLAVTPVESPAPVTAFVNVSVIPMDRERVLADQTVIVRDGRIAELGPAKKVRIPKGATRIDGKGKFLIPGLGDMHTHVHVHFAQSRAVDSVMLEQVLFLYLANGVTTIRNMEELNPLALRERAAKGELLSPRIYSSGQRLYDWVVGPPARAAAYVAMEQKAGYDFLKIYDVSPVLFDSLVAAARRQGVRFSGHLSKRVPFAHALEAGYASIEHLSGYPTEYQRRRSAGESDSSIIATLAAMTKRAGVWSSPTLTVYESSGTGSDSLLRLPEMRYAAPKRFDYWRGGVSPGGAVGDTGKVGDELKLRRKLIKALHGAGVGILLGTDSPDGFGVPGFSIHRELEALVVKAGLTPYQALEAGTRNVATFWGTLDSTGTVAAGKRADLVLLTGNPLVDIRRTAKPAGVMIGGRWLAREELDTRLKALENVLY